MNASRSFLTAMILMMAGCQGPNSRVATTLNKNAVLAGDISTDPLGWRVITSGLNPIDATMSTLFGNDSAVEYSRTNQGGNYPRNSVLALVTWRQQEDNRWFGARIPAHAKSVELVTVTGSEHGRTTYEYQSFEGIPLKPAETPKPLANQRATYLLSQRAAVMP